MQQYKEGQSGGIPKTYTASQTDTNPVRNPEADLNALQTELQETEARINAFTNQKELLKKDVDDLKSMVTDLNQIVEAYGKVFNNLDREKKELQCYFDAKMRIVETGLGERRKAVDSAIDEYDHQIEGKKEKIAELTTQYREEEKRWNGAKETLQKKQQDYDGVKNLQQKIINQLTEVKAVKELVEQEDTKQHTGGMYFLLKELKKALEDMEVKVLAEFRNDLYEAFDHLNEAKKTLRESKAKLDSAKGTLDQEQAKLQELETKRREELLKKINAMEPQPCPERSA